MEEVSTDICVSCLLPKVYISPSFHSFTHNLVVCETDLYSNIIVNSLDNVFILTCKVRLDFVC